MPIVTEVSNTENKPSRNTVAQCYEAIIKDLKEGADLLDEEFNKGKIKGLRIKPWLRSRSGWHKWLIERRDMLEK